jgi:hypothetical protein
MLKPQWCIAIAAMASVELCRYAKRTVPFLGERYATNHRSCRRSEPAAASGRTE